MPKFEGALAVNSILTKTQKLYEGDLVGPGSIAADSEGSLYNFQTISAQLFSQVLSTSSPPPPSLGGSEGGRPYKQS